jgi:nitrous-oxide reductase
MKRWILVGVVAIASLVAAWQMQGCAGTTAAKGGAGGTAAQRVYVKPGEHDAYYAFLSGGHHGNIYVYGIPSCRHITTIPVFTPEPA